MTVRRDEEISRELAELAERHPSRSAAVQAAIHHAWQHLQEAKLQAGYAAAVAETPHYPYDPLRTLDLFAPRGAAAA